MWNDPFLGQIRVAKCVECGDTCGGGLQKGSGDFTDCMTRIVPSAKPDDPEAFCADYEHRQTGRWPGEKRKSEGFATHDPFLQGGPGYTAIEKVWSDEAREAAAEARRNNARARSRDEGGPPDIIEDEPESKPEEKKPKPKPESSTGMNYSGGPSLSGWSSR